MPIARIAACAALLWMVPVQAGHKWPLSDSQLQDRVPGAHVAQRLDVDLNADGVVDTVVSLAYDDAPDRDAYRSVQVFWGHHQDPRVMSDEDDGDGGNGYANFESSPHGAPQLSFRKGILLVEDLTGGTTATQATYRYRFDPEADDMRLIGLDAERYSRTNSHGSIKLSWNVATGARIVQRGEINDDTARDDAALHYGPERRWVDKSRTYYYMPDTPNPDELLDAIPQ